MKKGLIFCIGLFLGGCQLMPLALDNNENQKKIPAEYAAASTIEETISYNCVIGKTPFEILKEKAANLEYDTYDLGVFVKAINGLANDNENNKYWLFFIDGMLANVAADKYICSNETLVEWKYGLPYPSDY